MNMGARFTELIIDAADPHALAAFWSAVLGWPPTGDEHADYVEIGDPSGALPTLVFGLVDDVKTVKNRVHIDVNPVGSDQEEELARLLALGATHVEVGQSGEESWFVLADPEGNEFCLLRTRRD
jgi:predicted enzyme related to lactoylglutathione lyase